MKCLIGLVFLVCEVSGTFNAFPVEEYDIENLVTEFGLQYCTFVEIGQGFCSIFAEFRDTLDTRLVPGTVAEVFLGECECSKIRDWTLCGPELTDIRPDDCRFREGTGRDMSSARVHRRLCDFDYIIASKNKACDCQKRFDDRPLHPVKGFLTCFRAPLPRSICMRHSVCGVHRCKSHTIEGLAMVRCNTRCKGMQPFCEEPRQIPHVSSYWSEWSSEHKISFSSARMSESFCTSRDSPSPSVSRVKKRAPAYDCLGPGAYCCPPEIVNCFCDVETTTGGRKVRRFLNFENQKDLRSVNVTKRARKRRHWLWDKLFASSRHADISEATENATFILSEPQRAEKEEAIFMIDYRTGKQIDLQDGIPGRELETSKGFPLPAFLLHDEEEPDSGICLERRNITEPICLISDPHDLSDTNIH